MFPDSPTETPRIAVGGDAPADATVGTLTAEAPAEEELPATDATMYAVILAGGIGSRFWPLATLSRPKPLLPLVNERPLIADTLERLRPIVPPARVLVVTSADIADAIGRAIPEVPAANLLVEPHPMGTAAAVAWAAHEISRRAGPDTVFCTLHADLAVGLPQEFRRLVTRAAALAQETEALVVLGARPTRPDTGFGYLVPGAPLAEGSGTDDHGSNGATNGTEADAADRDGRSAAIDAAIDAVIEAAMDAAPDVAPDAPVTPPSGGLGADRGGACRVARFVEKPDAVLAEALIGEGALWNCGTFLWSARTVLAELARAPEIAPGLAALARHDLPGFAGAVEHVSIDRGLLERTDRLVVLPADVMWDDVGTWASLRRARALDDSGNGAVGPARFVESAGNIVHTEAGPVVLYGVDGLVVVALGGYTFVTTMERAADLRALARELPAEFRPG